MRDIDNKSTSSVLEVKKLLDEFLGEYNQFRSEVSAYVESMNEITEQLSNARWSKLVCYTERFYSK